MFSRQDVDRKHGPVPLPARENANEDLKAHVATHSGSVGLGGGRPPAGRRGRRGRPATARPRRDGQERRRAGADQRRLPPRLQPDLFRPGQQGPAHAGLHVRAAGPAAVGPAQGRPAAAAGRAAEPAAVLRLLARGTLGRDRQHPLPAGRDHRLAAPQGRARHAAAHRDHRFRDPSPVGQSALRSLLHGDGRRGGLLAALGRARRPDHASTGIPIHPVFSQPKEQPGVPSRLGLGDDRPVVLQLAGGFGMGPVEKLFSGLLSRGQAAGSGRGRPAATRNSGSGWSRSRSRRSTGSRSSASPPRSTS